MSREIQAFKNARLVFNVLARVVKAEEHEAMEFPTEDALAKYLKEHPRAKPDNHTVKRPKHDDKAAPLDKKDVEQAAQHAISTVTQVEKMLEGHHNKEDANYVEPLEKQMPRQMSDLRKSVDTMVQGVNHIPSGQDREKAKEIVKKLDDAWEKPNKDLGFRWNRPGHKPYLHAKHVEEMLKTTKPLIHELDKILQGQRVLLAKRG
jgi:hypothetical protein